MRIWVVCLAALVMLAAGAGAFAQTKDVDIPYQKFVLDNGLTLIVHDGWNDFRSWAGLARMVSLLSRFERQPLIWSDRNVSAKEDPDDFRKQASGSSAGCTRR